ncbi:MAG: hypothetical protein AAF378_22750 [Cyanobacteria bacterium P01_A01_bin.84]
MNWQIITNSIILGITLPTTLLFDINLTSASAQENFGQPILNHQELHNQKLHNQILISEASETEDTTSETLETEDTTSETSETKKSGSTAVFQTLIRTVGDVIKTDIKTKRQQSQQTTGEETPTSQYSEETSESAPQISGENDSATEKLAKWGWTKIPCKPELVFIYGLAEDTICIEPNETVSVGQYQYDSNTHQLKPIKTNETASSENTPPTVANDE